jgi:type II secretion system protein I
MRLHFERKRGNELRSQSMSNFKHLLPYSRFHPAIAPATNSSPDSSSGDLFRFCAAFTLLEVMVAIAFIGFAMLALLSLHHSGMQSVARARELTQAMMLAQGLMTDAEQTRFPEPGRFSGNFQKTYGAEYPKFRWQRIVEQSQDFPDVRRVRITVFYGPRFRRTFVLTEFMHNPLPQLMVPGAQNNRPAGQQNPAASGGGD